MMKFLYLSEEQMIEAGVKDMPKCMQTMEEMFKLLKQGDYRMGGEQNNSHGLRVQFPAKSSIDNMPLAAPGRWFTAMPAYLGGKYHVFGIKTYGANQRNSEKGLPRSILMMSLLDVETGTPLAYMSANILSAMRTGAVSGIGARYLAPPNAKKLAVIGPGVMAKYSLDAIMLGCPSIEEIAILGRGQKNIDKFKEYCLKKEYNFSKIEICSSVEEVCENADIVLTTNSQAEQFKDYPLIRERYIKSGALVIVVSALRVEKAYVYDDSKCVCIADDIRQYEAKRNIDARPGCEDETITYKEALHDKVENDESVLSIYDIIDNSQFIRDEKKTYIFASGGIPLEDVAWAYECYVNASNNNIGIELPLWECSEL